MKILVSRIAKELKKAKHCGIYEPELSRVWPPNGRSREAEITYFAEQHGWRLRFYKEGFCAIFDKAPRKRKPITKLPRIVC
jgi:hypothetical protein